MKDLILKEAISESTVSQWLTAIAFIPDPDESIIEAASELLQNIEFSSNFAFSISSLTHTYCIQRSECHKESGVIKILQYLESYFRENYQNVTNKQVLDNVSTKYKILCALSLVLIANLFSSW